MATRPVNFKVLLRQINAVRVAASIGTGELQEMPQGELQDAIDCPIAVALSNGVEADVGPFHIELYFSPDAGIELMDEQRLAITRDLRQSGFQNVKWLSETTIKFATTRTMANFITRFDSEEFKHLIKGYQEEEDAA